MKTPIQAMLGLVFASLLLAPASRALAAAGPANFVYEGVLTDNSDAPVTTSVAFKLSVVDGAGCVIRRENFGSINLGATNGRFSLTLGAGSVEFNGGSTFVDAFARGAAVTGYGGCTPDVSATSTRSVVVSAGGSDMTPAVPIGSTPYAMIADTLQGMAPSDFIQAVAASSLNQTSANALFSYLFMTPANWTEMQALIAGTSVNYAKVPSGGGAALPSFSGTPGSAAAGQIWYDTVAHQLKYYDGAASQALLTGGGVSIASGTIGGSTGVNTTGSIATTGNMSAGTLTSTAVTATAIGAKQIAIWRADSAYKTTISAPAALGADNSFVLPPNSGTSGQFLSTDGSGNLAWTNAGGGGGASAGAADAVQISNGSGGFTASTDLVFATSTRLLGVGTNVPQFSVDVLGNDGDPTIAVTNSSSTTFHAPGFLAKNYGAQLTGGPQLYLFNSRGTNASPAQVQNGDLLGQIVFAGQADTSFGGVGKQGAMIQARAEATFGPSMATSNMAFFTATGNSLIQRMVITGTGQVGIGTTVPAFGAALDVYGHVAFSGPVPQGVTCTGATGASLASTSTDAKGVIAIPSGSAADCTVTFSTMSTYSAAPVCVATWQSTSLVNSVITASPTTTTVKFIFSTPITSATGLAYHCIQ